MGYQEFKDTLYLIILKKQNINQKSKKIEVKIKNALSNFFEDKFLSNKRIKKYKFELKK